MAGLKTNHKPVSGLTIKNCQLFSGRYNVIDKIENADKATMRQLLQHSSGIFNYIQNLNFQTALLNDFIKEWKPKNY